MSHQISIRGSISKITVALASLAAIGVTSRPAVAAVAAQLKIPYANLCVQVVNGALRQQACDPALAAQQFELPTVAANSFALQLGSQCVQDNQGALQMVTCAGANNQRWTYRSAGADLFLIVNAATNLCLNVAYAATTPGGVLISYGCDANSSNEKFAVALVTKTPPPAVVTQPVVTPVVTPAPVPVVLSARDAEVAKPTFMNFPNSYFTLTAGQSYSVGGATLRLTTGGDVQVVDGAGAVLWHSASSAACGTCTLVMQGDGNLVLYANGNGVWGSGTWNRGSLLTFSSVAPYLSIRDANFNVIWSDSNTPGPKALLAAANDGPTAAPARSFLDSLAVNSHVEQNGISAADMMTMLNYLGVKTIRDGWNAGLTERYTVMAKQGVRFDLGAGDPYAANASVGFEAIAAMTPGALVATEGPNEINNWSFVTNGVTSPHGWPNAAGPLVQQFMTKLFTNVHQNPKLAGVPVYNLTWGGTTDAEKYGMFDLKNQADFGNIHFYPPGQPYAALRTAFAGAYRHVLPNQAVITETGYDTKNVSELAQAIMTLNLYLAAFQQGFNKTYVYELYDEWQTYGLFKNVSTPKRAATAIHNLTTILADTAAPSSAGTLNYSIPGLPATAHTLLLQKSSGAFDLLVWNEVPVYANGADVTPAAVPLTVNFGTTVAGGAVYDPVNGLTATQTIARGSSVAINLAGRALVIEVRP